MIPGMNPRQMQQAMRKLGIQQTEIDAVEVIIRTADKEIIVENPQVSKVNMMGQISFQISGTLIERNRLPEKIQISDDDVETVASQANVSVEVARKSIEDCNGDLAEAILKLKS